MCLFDQVALLRNHYQNQHFTKLFEGLLLYSSAHQNRRLKDSKLVIQPMMRSTRLKKDVIARNFHIFVYIFSTHMLILSALIYVYIFIPHVFIFSALIYMFILSTLIYFQPSYVYIFSTHMRRKQTMRSPDHRAWLKGLRWDFF